MSRYVCGPCGKIGVTFSLAFGAEELDLFTVHFRTHDDKTDEVPLLPETGLTDEITGEDGE